MDPWLLFFDLDGTLWDHLDVSSTRPPFMRISDNSISDSEGEVLTLNAGATDFITWARSSGGIVSTCSWNKPDYARAALKAFDLDSSFDYHRISTDPGKNLLMLDLIRELESRGQIITRDRIFYMDDRDIHMEDVRESLPELTFLHIWKDVRDFDAAKSIISAKLGIQ